MNTWIILEYIYTDGTQASQSTQFGGQEQVWASGQERHFSPQGTELLIRWSTRRPFLTEKFMAIKQLYLNLNLSSWLLGLYSLRRRRLIGIGIPIINLWRSSDRLRFIMGIPISVRRPLFSEYRPLFVSTSDESCHNLNKEFPPVEIEGYSQSIFENINQPRDNISSWCHVFPWNAIKYDMKEYMVTRGNLIQNTVKSLI